MGVFDKIFGEKENNNEISTELLCERAKCEMFTDRHISKSAGLLLKDFVNDAVSKALSSEDIDSFSVVLDMPDGKRFYSDNEFDTYDLLSDLVKNDEKDFEMQDGANNVVLQLNLKEADFPVIIHIAGEAVKNDAGENVFAFFRASMVWEEEDGKHNGSCGIIYDSIDEDVWNDRLKEVFEKYEKNDDSLTDDDMEVVVAADFPDGDTDTAAELLDKGKYVDALNYALPVYNNLKDIYNQGGLSEEECNRLLNDLSGAAFVIGMAYRERTIWKKALYYLEMARMFANDQSHDTFQINYIRTLFDAGDWAAKYEYEEYKEGYEKSGSKDEETEQYIEYFEEALQDTTPKFMQSLLYQILHNYGVMYHEVSSMIQIDRKGERKDFGTYLEIAQYDVVDEIVENNEVTLYITYRSSRDKMKGKDECVADNGHDVSDLCRDSEIIVHIKRYGNKAIVTAMIPQFANSPIRNKEYALHSFVYYLGGMMSFEEFEEKQRTGAEKLSKGEQMEYDEYYSLGKDTDAHYHFLVGTKAYNEKVYGSAIYLLTVAYDSIAAKRYTDDIDDIDKGMMLETAFMLGVIYMDYQIYDMAYAYLSIVFNFSDDLKYRGEYINCLCNQSDVRALYVVQSELDRVTNGDFSDEAIETIEEYRLFLQRRYGFMLVEQNRIEQAEMFFNSLLADPVQKDFAQKELEYIHQMKYDK